MPKVAPMNETEWRKARAEHREQIRHVPTWQLKMWLANTDSEWRAAHFREELAERTLMESAEGGAGEE